MAFCSGLALMGAVVKIVPPTQDTVVGVILAIAALLSAAMAIALGRHA
jgi:hypothetical protein